MIYWAILDNSLPDRLGYIPHFLDPSDPRPAAEQFDDNYIGGWRPMKGFTLERDGMRLQYPDDPDMMPWAVAHFRDETIWVYPYSWVMVVGKDGKFEVSRMD